jgi:hypothetical protein
MKINTSVFAEFGAPTRLFNRPHPVDALSFAVILRVCDFFDFAQIVMLKENSLRAKKIANFQKSHKL